MTEDSYRNFRDELRSRGDSCIVCVCGGATARRERNEFLFAAAEGDRETASEKEREREENVLFGRDNEKTRGASFLLVEVAEAILESFAAFVRLLRGTSVNSRRSCAREFTADVPPFVRRRRGGQ